MATATASHVVPRSAPARMDRIVPVLVVLGLAVLLASCDTVDPGGETITLQPADVADLTFRFASDSVPVGEVTTLTAENAVDLADFLDAQGYSKGDVISAQVESAQLRVGFPLNVQASFLNEVEVQFEASNMAPRTVASSSSLANSRQVSLNVQSGNVAGFVTRPQFDVVLLIEPNELQPSEDYELIVDLSIRIEVESL